MALNPFFLKGASYEQRLIQDLTNLNGKKAVIVGRSNLNGKPMTQLLLKENCTVTITHSKTKNLNKLNPLITFLLNIF